MASVLKPRFGDKSLGITTKDLIPVLLIIMMGMAGLYDLSEYPLGTSRLSLTGKH